MSTRTIIEINHDHLTLRTASLLCDLLQVLGGSSVTQLLNEAHGKPVEPFAVPGIRILAQRHHSETLTLEVKS